MKLIIARHGQTEWNVIRRYQGQTDVALSDHGRWQARTVAARLRNSGFAAIYSSDLSRAADTARTIAAAHEPPLAVRTDPRFREIAAGRLEGMTRAQVDDVYPGFHERWLTSPDSCRMPGGETLAEVQQRVGAGYRELAERHPGERVLLVAHGFATITLLALALRLPLAHFRRLWIDTTGLSEIWRLDDGHTVVKRINDCAHLEETGASASPSAERESPARPTR